MKNSNLKMKTKLFCVVVIAFSFSLAGCDCLDNQCTFPPKFRLVDKLTGSNLLKGPNAVYHIDSIYAMIPGDSTVIRYYTYDSSYIEQSNYTVTGNTLYLHLNAGETDTLQVNYNHKHSTICCGNGTETASSVTLQGSPIKNENYAFTIKK